MSTISYPIYVDGVIHEPGAAHVRADDEALTLGLAAFDTLLVEGGLRRFETRHLARLERTCRALDIDCPAREAIVRAWNEYAARLGSRPCVLRTTITRGAPQTALEGHSDVAEEPQSRARTRPSLVIAARDLAPAPESGAVLVVEERFRLAGDALDSLKTTNRARYTLARERARDLGAFDALLLNTAGSVVESTSANVWLVFGDTFVTPPLARGALDGIVRRVLFEELTQANVPVDERAIELEDLACADEIFLTNSSLRVTPVAAVREIAAKVPRVRGSAARLALERISAAELR